MIPMIELKSRIKDFLAKKNLSLNSQKSYTYDLEQFFQQVGEGIDEHSLRLYQESLADLKPSARKRKSSAVNQFLYFLYENDLIDRFYKLKVEKEISLIEENKEVLDLAILYNETAFKDGQLISLLILELGLVPSELAAIEVAKIDKDFRVLTMKKGANVRIISLPEQLLSYLVWKDSQIYLFDKGGKPYSRQWFFNQLKSFCESLGLAHLTAQTLREQFILREKDRGIDIMELAQKLGLKSPITLEKYYKNGY